MNPAETSNRAHASPLRMRLLLLAASGLLPLVMVFAWGLDHLVHERETEAQRAVLELSRALATAVDSEMRSTIRLLEHMGTSDELERADLRGFHLSARRAAEQFGWRQVVLTDGEARVLFRSSEPFDKTTTGPVEPKSLAAAIATQRPVVSQVVETPNQPSDAFAIRVPVIRGGDVVYVLTAVLPTDVVLSVLTRQDIPRGWIASVFDQNNHRVARSRPSPSPLPSKSLQVLLDRPGVQGIGRTVTVEGIDNFTGFTRLADSRWSVVVGTSVEETNKSLYALLQAVLLGLVASLALGVLLAWVLARRVVGPIETLKQGATALGRGEPVQLPPLDIVELDDVAVALTHAAADRDRAAAQVNDALRMAEEASRSKDQFLAMLGHELRNPLAPIAHAVQIMALRGDEKTAAERRVIERQLVHVTRLVDDLLDVSRITSGRLTLQRTQVRIADVLRHVADGVRPSLYQHSLSLNLGPGVNDAWVTGDEVRLVQVFNNLLVNAIKFTPPGNPIHIKANVEGSQVCIDVEDTGIGIAPTEIERIFDLFYQAPQSPDRARGGLGLGLPIVKSLVEMHGGTVQASSAGLGHGTCITVRLPLCEAPVTNERHAPAPATRGLGKILVVDDNEDAADTCAALLELSGYTVRAAYTPEAALETLHGFKPEVAILDIGLPGMSGFKLARLMKEAPYNYRGRLVALTGYGQAADMAASKDAGFDAHLTKPVSATDLLTLIGDLFDRGTDAVLPSAAWQGSTAT
jgi:signal transduction histidine kinase/ActR/RegA family two-component response regulator